MHALPPGARTCTGSRCTGPPEEGVAVGACTCTGPPTVHLRTLTSTRDPEGPECVGTCEHAPVPLEPVPLLAPVSTPDLEEPMHLSLRMCGHLQARLTRKAYAPSVHLQAPASTPDPEEPVHLEPVRAPTSTPDPEGLESVLLLAPASTPDPEGPVHLEVFSLIFKETNQRVSHTKKHPEE